MSTNVSDPGTVLTITGVDTITGAITFTVSHQYLDDGLAAGQSAGSNDTVTDTAVDDDDGGASVDVLSSAVVQGVGLVDGTLYIISTDGRDKDDLKGEKGLVELIGGIGDKLKQ